MKKNGRKLINIFNLARRLRMPIGWLQQEAESGRIPSLKVMDLYFFDPDHVEMILLKRARSEWRGRFNE